MAYLALSNFLIMAKEFLLVLPFSAVDKLSTTALHLHFENITICNDFIIF